MNILFKMTGSIACYKACDLISRFVKAGHSVQTVTTSSAEKFIGPATLEGLTGRANLSDLWETGDQMAHIRLPEWADVVLLCPATANSINRLASGVGDDLVSTLFLAHDFNKPYFIAPAMNPRMMSHPATAASLIKLEKMGVTLLPTEEGRLACGDFGHGKLLDPEAIFEIVLRQNHSMEKVPKVLVTAGGTEEPIDSVRVLSNLSSGKTGAFLADFFSSRGAEVTLLRSLRAVSPTHPRIRQQSFQSVAELEELLKKECAMGRYDCVVHLAAVSDFSVELPANAQETGSQKISSDSPVELRLVPTPKLLPNIKGWAPADHPPLVVGFKLTDRLDDTKSNPALALYQTHGVDAVVHNARESINAEGELHPCRLYLPDEEIRLTQTKDELAAALWELALLAKSPMDPAGTSSQ
jgi:phosphopantothenoylcysteine decarboxylase/phosphopantothenate--cysteine ligase